MILVEEDFMKQKAHQGFPVTRETKIIRSSPSKRELYARNNPLNKPKHTKKPQQEEILDRTFVLDETLPPLEIG